MNISSKAPKLSKLADEALQSFREKDPEMFNAMQAYAVQELETKAQPFKTNYLLENIIKSQTPKWVSYIMLLLTILILVLTLFQFFVDDANLTAHSNPPPHPIL